jgi:hypothetical protein
MITYMYSSYSVVCWTTFCFNQSLQTAIHVNAAIS